MPSSPLAALGGTWKGYVENFQFSDQSDAVTMAVTNTGDGQVTVGASPPLPAPTDPDVGYPPGGNLAPSPWAVYPGFPYTIHSPSYADGRLQFDLDSGELWSAWCALQTPVADDANPGSYGCLPNWATTFGSNCSQTNPKTNETVSVDCGKIQLCEMGHACQCTAQSCSANLGASVHFDLVVTPPKADGSVAGLDQNAQNTHNVHLTKQ